MSPSSVPEAPLTRPEKVPRSLLACDESEPRVDVPEVSPELSCE